ncbi:phosphonate metabolism transcriptional regulator PhnF [Aquamicrobium sp. LC103]|uniref:phosphonate metabolism transcriptional regulator PhnF n=1 Tax=Aquamicrobium sp. LC103 TaxID=1120658 RepID=UPI000699D5BD|nr:phosphonate metabolism transcriptional regulator PhnF [Aquamicrobium sp. LC103]TKT69922.1 phosphonate metabolism transcriptional regulator PhnF [Aquamicrobium sp. LC103]
MGLQQWQMIRDRIADDIAAGELAPGARLPTETKLCQLFGAGRHSVRRAVSALAIEGKLRVEQGRGTFVEDAPLIDYHIGRRARFRQNLRSQGVVPAGEVISAQVMPASTRVARALQLNEGDPVLRILTRGFADSVPISIGLSFHSVARFPDMAAQRQAGRHVTEIYRDAGIGDYFRKSTTVFARRAEPEEAELLSQHPDQPVLVVRKTDVDSQDLPIAYSEGIWAADRVRFTFDVDPVTAAGFDPPNQA